MKAQWTLIIALLALLASGCASEMSSNQASYNDGVPVVDIPEEPFEPEEDGPGEGAGDNWQYGGSADLDIVSLSRMSDYTKRPMNEVKDAYVHLNLRHISGNSYGGVVSVVYKENNIQYAGHFTSGTTEKTNQYNVWFKNKGNNVYHGFFEDFMGGIVIVLDKVLDLGDGVDDGDSVGGSIWYKNFSASLAPNPLYGSLPGFGRPQTYCWFISLGPYDCRAWKTDRAVDTTRAVYPDNGYKKLGTFEGLSLEKAFNGQLEVKM